MHYYTCAICQNALSDRARSELCVKCRGRYQYWTSPERGALAILARQKQLKLWQSRMLYIANKEGGKEYGKVRRAITATAHPA